MTRLGRERITGMRNAVLASLFLGWAPILGRLAYAADVTPFTLVAFRTLVAALLLWAGCLLFRRSAIPISWGNLLGCIAVGTINGIGSLLYYTGLSHLNASLASLLNTIYPLWVVIFLLAAGQPLARLTFLRLGLGLAGIYLLTRAERAAPDWLGVMLMIASAATYGWHLVMGQWLLADLPSRTATLYILTTMAAVVGIARLAQTAPLELISGAGWEAILALGLTTALSRLAMFSGLEQLGGVETALVTLLELLVTLVVAFLLLGERLTPLQWVGGGLLLVGTLLVGLDAAPRLDEAEIPLDTDAQ